MADAFDRIRQTIEQNKIVIFMKGTPQAPQCGFSAAAVEVFQDMGVPFVGVDVLEDPELRRAIKEFTNWPTIPQVFIGGKFVGGSDIVREMYLNGELEPLVKAALEG